ncbi:MAG: hypothetical protein H6R15_794 [Proteobacteria bacterium]|nr:hypothetical protein [Pseudomonadota bacterium]
MRILLVALAVLATSALAEDSALRPSARLLFKHPELLQPGTCAIYEEGGSGWVVTEPVYYLRGSVVASEVRTRHLGICPQVPGKSIGQYSRQEFNRHVLAHPCVSPGIPERDEQIGVVRLRVSDWETPHGVKAANAGRLYRGTFVDQPLKKDMEIELEADLLGLCQE